jgi:GntR family transcriptional repressor for pyruvate dehydrogenase complex
MKRGLSKITNVAPKIRPVAKTSISDEIVDQIMELIARGDLQPGQRLPSERELCVRFGAGRSSLREALRCLSIVGVLNARVGEGTSVAADGGKFLGKILEWRLITERHDIENLMEVRIGLEGVAAASAARTVTDDNLKVLDVLLDKMKRCNDDPKRFATLDIEFHLTIAKFSGNPLLSDMISMIRGQLVRVLARVLLIPNAIPLSLKEHVRIVDCLRRREPEASREVMSDHLQRALDRYRKFTALDVETESKPRIVATKKRVSRISAEAILS